MEVVEDIQMGTIILTIIIPAVMIIPAAIPTGMTTSGFMRHVLACTLDSSFRGRVTLN
jgi:hypothetical protein